MRVEWFKIRCINGILVFLKETIRIHRSENLTQLRSYKKVKHLFDINIYNIDAIIYKSKMLFFVVFGDYQHS